MSDESELCDFGQYPEIYADGVGEIQILGVNARVMFFSWQRMEGVFRRTIVATVVRPVSSLGADFDLIESVKKRPAFAPHGSATTLQ